MPCCVVMCYSGLYFADSIPLYIHVIQCSVSCGEGIITRQVRCRQASSSTNSNDNIYLADDSCDVTNKPTTTSRCNPGPCTVKWIASDWSLVRNEVVNCIVLSSEVIWSFCFFLQCYPKCGRGISTRMVYCVSVTDHNQKYPETLCDNRIRPSSRKECSSSATCSAMWHGSQWSGVSRFVPSLICFPLTALSRDVTNTSHPLMTVFLSCFIVYGVLWCWYADAQCHLCSA